MVLKKYLLLGISFLFFARFSYGQDIVIKSNLLYDATTTMNLGVEIKTGAKTTFELPFNYNPWTFSKNKKAKHFLVQPELRFWTCEAFSGHFFGIHGHYSYFNVGGIGPLKIIKNYRHEGWLAGAGISYGYNWFLSKRWSIEATVGVGYAYMDYGRYECQKCGEKIADKTHHYFGPTKAGITLIYYLK